MTQATETPSIFVDRRNYDHPSAPPVVERRQFANSHEGLSPEAKELALAIDRYKMLHRRRFISHEELLLVIKSLGYHRDTVPAGQ